MADDDTPQHNDDVQENDGAGSRRLPRKGRPPKYPTSGARYPHSVRLKPETSRAIRASAERNNRSIGEDLEARIDASLLAQDPEIQRTGRDMSYVIAHIESQIGHLKEHIDKRLDDLNETISRSMIVTGKAKR